MDMIQGAFSYFASAETIAKHSDKVAWLGTYVTPVKNAVSFVGQNYHNPLPLMGQALKFRIVGSVTVSNVFGWMFMVTKVATPPYYALVSSYQLACKISKQKASIGKTINNIEQMSNADLAYQKDGEYRQLHQNLIEMINGHEKGEARPLYNNHLSLFHKSCAVLKLIVPAFYFAGVVGVIGTAAIPFIMVGCGVHKRRRHRQAAASLREIQNGLYKPQINNLSPKAINTPYIKGDDPLKTGRKCKSELQKLSSDFYSVMRSLSKELYKGCNKTSGKSYELGLHNMGILAACLYAAGDQNLIFSLQSGSDMLLSLRFSGFSAIRQHITEASDSSVQQELLDTLELAVEIQNNRDKFDPRFSQMKKTELLVELLRLVRTLPLEDRLLAAREKLTSDYKL